MKTTLNSALLSLLTILLMSSCKKNEVDVLYLKYTLDGVNYTFTDGHIIDNHFGSGGGGETYAINVSYEQQYGSTPLLPHFTIYFYQKYATAPTHAERAEFDAVGSYNYLGADGSESFDTTKIFIRMYDTDSIEYRTKADTAVFDPSENQFHIVKEELTDHSFSDIIQGTFECVLYKASPLDPGPEFYKLTKGEFRSRTWNND